MNTIEIVGLLVVSNFFQSRNDTLAEIFVKSEYSQISETSNITLELAIMRVTRWDKSRRLLTASFGKTVKSMVLTLANASCPAARTLEIHYPIFVHSLARLV